MHKLNRRYNSDDLLRKLEREAMKTYDAHTSAVDVPAWIRLWREQLRRGILPTPNQGGLSTNYWWVLPVSMATSSIVGWWPQNKEARYISVFSNRREQHNVLYLELEEVPSLIALMLDEYERGMET